MKLKPKTELQILAAILLAVAVVSLVGPIVIAPSITKLLATPWREVFASQFYHDHIAAMMRQTFFILFPCIAVLNGWVAWKLLSAGLLYLRVGAQSRKDRELDRVSRDHDVWAGSDVAANDCCDLHPARGLPQPPPSRCSKMSR